jgi:hypothetical protein
MDFRARHTRSARAEAVRHIASAGPWFGYVSNRPQILHDVRGRGRQGLEHIGNAPKMMLDAPEQHEVLVIQRLFGGRPGRLLRISGHGRHVTGPTGGMAIAATERIAGQ